MRAYLSPYYGNFFTGCFVFSNKKYILSYLYISQFAKTFEERLNKKVAVRKLLLEINRKIPIDIIVYSRAEFNMVKQYGNNFITEIEKTGKVIYVKAGC